MQVPGIFYTVDEVVKLANRQLIQSISFSTGLMP